MNNIAASLKCYLEGHLNLYRIITGLGFIIAALMVLLTPVQMPDPDDWAYYYGIQNFSQGHFTINNLTQNREAMETARQGSILLQYLPIAYNRWALEKAPGYVFYMIPFQKLGIPRYGNMLLALGVVLVTYILLKRLRDEKAAMLGSLLMLFTPISLVMLNRIYMDTYASMAFLAMGGGLYLYYHLQRGKSGAVKGAILLFTAFFLISWSVITRYTNLPVALVLFLHLAATRWLDWQKGQKSLLKVEAAPLFLGIALPVLAMALYDYAVFGSPLTYGYKLTPFPIKFAFQYLGQVDAQGVSIPGQIVLFNLQGFARNLWIGFPLLLVGLPGFAVLLYFKLAGHFRHTAPAGKWSSLSAELPLGIFWVLTGWFLFVFFLYLTYEWTAGLKNGGGFVLLNRFLLPGLLPVVIVSALVLSRFPLKALIPFMAAVLAGGGLLYTQWAQNLHILPAWLTVRTLETRWPGYIFPPWVVYPPADSGGPFFPWHIPPGGAGPFPPK